VLSSQRGGRPRFILALLLLTALTLVTLDARGFGPVESARGLTMTVLSPFRSLVGWVTSPVESTWNGVWGYRDLEEENAALRARIAELEGQDFREITAEQVLRQLYVQSDLTFAGDVPQVLARVVEGPAGNFEHTVTIDKGSDHGIQVGMAVVTGAGLVGRIDRVTPNRSVVQLMTDPRMVVGVRLISTGDLGLIEGRGRGRSPELVVSPEVNLPAGERLETSGLQSSFYPPDIPIGRILGTTGEPTDDDEDGATTTTAPVGNGTELPDLEAVVPQRQAVELSADLESLRFLTVLLWTPPE
jgi:rod shape-determining protein MreC